MKARIAITGTHSTGKSTFLESLAGRIQETGHSVERIADKATDCRTAGFPILDQHTTESTLWIMASVIKSELEAELRSDVILVDRPVSDALVYLEAALEYTKRYIPSNDRSYLYGLARNHCQRYHVIFRTVLDPNVPLGSNRDKDLPFRALVDTKVAPVLEELGIRPLSINPLEIESSITKALQMIDR